jgi:ABC-type uncharacterized transport system permease subunit
MSGPQIPAASSGSHCIEAPGSAGGASQFWLLGSDAARFIHELFHAASDRPVDIFGARTRTFLLFIVPIGALTQIPASMVLGRYSLVQGALASLWLAALGLLVFAAWNRSFRRYESALG